MTPSQHIDGLVERLRKGGEGISSHPNARYYKIPPTAKELEAAAALESIKAERDEAVRLGQEAIAEARVGVGLMADMQAAIAAAERQLTILLEALTDIAGGSDGFSTYSGTNCSDIAKDALRRAGEGT